MYDEMECTMCAANSCIFMWMGMHSFTINNLNLLLECQSDRDLNILHQQ